MTKSKIYLLSKHFHIFSRAVDIFMVDVAVNHMASDNSEGK